MKLPTAPLEKEVLRETIISNPELVLNDTVIMQALVSANDKTRGDNVIDLRGAAMKSLESKLGSLENTHRSVIAAAYDNLAGTQQINRAILKILEPNNFKSFLEVSAGDMVKIMKIDFACLILEQGQKNATPKLSNVGKHLIHAPVGFVKEYMQIKEPSNDLKVKLRQVKTPDPFVFSKASCKIGSEACLALNFGDNSLPGILVLGAKNPHQFSSTQGTDLLTFFATVYELLARRLLP
tara:strand:+ start:136 stop:849 length:714 start_codon:yes stop_codon:yes gene_type:complete